MHPRPLDLNPARPHRSYPRRHGVGLGSWSVVACSSWHASRGDVDTHATRVILNPVEALRNAVI